MFLSHSLWFVVQMSKYLQTLVMMATLDLVLTVGVLTTIYSQQAFAVAVNPGAAGAQVNQTLHIDVPVKLDKAKVVFDIGHLVLWGDAPFFIGDIHLLTSDISQWNIPGQVIAVFHGDAAYLVLNDEAYNTNRHVQTGNPYGKAIADLMKQGCTNRVVRRHRCSQPLGQCRPPSRSKGQHQCNS
jgi:hypothetical protein